MKKGLYFPYTLLTPKHDGKRRDRRKQTLFIAPQKPGTLQS